MNSQHVHVTFLMVSQMFRLHKVEFASNVFTLVYTKVETCLQKQHLSPGIYTWTIQLEHIGTGPWRKCHIFLTSNPVSLLFHLQLFRRWSDSDLPRRRHVLQRLPENDHHQLWVQQDCMWDNHFYPALAPSSGGIRNEMTHQAAESFVLFNCYLKT